MQRIIWLIYSLDIRLFFALQTQTEYDLHRHGVSPVSFCHSGLDPESRRLRNQY